MIRANRYTNSGIMGESDIFTQHSCLEKIIGGEPLEGCSRGCGGWTQPVSLLTTNSHATFGKEMAAHSCVLATRESGMGAGGLPVYGAAELDMSWKWQQQQQHGIIFNNLTDKLCGD